MPRGEPLSTNLLALVALVPLVGWTVWLRLTTGSFLSPGTLFALWWSWAAGLPLLLSPDDPVSVAAMTFLLAASVCVALGAAVGAGGMRTVTAPDASEEFAPGRLRTAALVTALLGIGSSITFLLFTGLTAAELARIENLVLVSSQLYGVAHSELFRPPLVSQALLPFAYVSPVLGGLLAGSRPTGGERLLSLPTLVPGVLITVLQTTKAATLFALLLWISGYLAARARRGRLDLFSRGHLLAGGVLAGVVTVFVLATSLARLGATDLALLDVAALKIRGAALGHLTVFSRWLEHHSVHPEPPSLGLYSFAGSFERFGLGVRIRGLFEDSMVLANGDVSNIYTAFRPLIQDFTLAGAFVILSALGFMGGRAFRLLTSGRWRAAPFLIAFYATVFWTPFTFLWTYNSMIVAFVLLTVMLPLMLRPAADRAPLGIPTPLPARP